jgi:hypothetical protein
MRVTHQPALPSTRATARKHSPVDHGLVSGDATKKKAAPRDKSPAARYVNSGFRDRLPSRISRPDIE